MSSVESILLIKVDYLASLEPGWCTSGVEATGNPERASLVFNKSCQLVVATGFLVKELQLGGPGTGPGASG